MPTRSACLWGGEHPTLRTDRPSSCATSNEALDTQGKGREDSHSPGGSHLHSPLTAPTHQNQMPEVTEGENKDTPAR
jgi:hypothetical protein